MSPINNACILIFSGASKYFEDLPKLIKPSEAIIKSVRFEL